MEELARIAIANDARPKRHHLHIAACTHGRDRVFAEAAFHLHQAEHQRFVETGALGLIPDGLQKIAAHFPIGLAAAQAVAHRAEPAQVANLGFGRDKHRLGRRSAVDGGAEGRAYRIDQRFFQLSARMRRLRRSQPSAWPGQQRCHGRTA